MVWFYFNCASNTSTSSYSGFVSALWSSVRRSAVSSVYASARIGVPLLGVYGDVGCMMGVMVDIRSFISS